jgi:hypothetical protein
LGWDQIHETDSPALPDSSTRRETVDHFRSEIERLRFITDVVSALSLYAIGYLRLIIKDVLKSQLSDFQRMIKILGGTYGLGGLAPDTGAKLVGRR